MVVRREVARKHKRALFEAFKAGLESESHWGFKYNSLPRQGQITRIRFFLKWYHLKYDKYGLN